MLKIFRKFQIWLKHVDFERVNRLFKLKIQPYAFILARISSLCFLLGIVYGEILLGLSLLEALVFLAIPGIAAALHLTAFLYFTISSICIMFNKVPSQLVLHWQIARPWLNWNFLALAMLLGKEKLVLYLIEKGFPSTILIENCGLLEVAIDLKRTQVAKDLIKRKQLNLWVNEPPIYCAVDSGQEEILRLLVEAGEPVHLSFNGMTLLQRCIQNKQVNAAKYLISQGAPFSGILFYALENGVSGLGESSLNKELEAMPKEEKERYLFQILDLAVQNVSELYSASSDATTWKSHYPDFWSDSIRDVYYILMAFQDIDMQNDKGDTPSHCLLAYSDLPKDLIKVVLSFRPNLSLRNRNGLSVKEALLQHKAGHMAFQEVFNEMYGLTFVCQNFVQNNLPAELSLTILLNALPQYVPYKNVKSLAERQWRIFYSQLEEALPQYLPLIP